MTTTLTISQLGKACGLSRSALLYYHRLGLVRSAGRSQGNYRLYTPLDVERVKQIRFYRDMGIPLKQIAQLLTQLEGGGKAQDILRHRLQTLAAEIQKLQKQEAEILALLKHMAVKPPTPKPRARARDQAKFPLPFTENNMVNKKRWVEIMDAAGFDDAAKKRWHASFEKMEPDAHREFLESLGMAPEEIAKVRAWSIAKS